ncbi:flagellar basal-body MS-ring/collar protein FliF [Dyella kyungheensis]|uniref:Flagellar M-ring protein n=1 Tax=Dyella kyungheensis TaxID=1242174 RepID=A0ABS2JPH8_9GAMM|nr:flagellar basal-body MS-ring/collar protein FliF [Dyella kyungheensis]MBM7120922.1 flagellar M-ring protein FliF [Dyella kyungheensis]
MKQFFAAMSRRARWAFAVGVIAIACIAGAATWWVTHPPYGLLFRDLREADAAEITAALTQMQTPYRLADDGKAILVPSEQVYDTRMKLVSQGVPKGGSVGFELFKDSDYGVTEFAQKVNFQRALQGELERTIESLDEVSAARVHLTIHRTDLFERDKDASKASVTLSLRPQKHLDARAVAGVQRLVASAVDGLSAESVVVLDDRGVTLSGYAADGTAGEGLGGRMDQQARLESDLRGKIGALLHRVLLTDDFTVSVDVRMNYDHVKQVSERLLGQGKDGNGLLVHERVNSSTRTEDDPDSDRVKSSPASNDRDVEYAHGREQEEVERAVGRIERISVGVVIPSTLSATEIARLSEVVSAGLGLDVSRGDHVDIAAIAPSKPVARDAATVPAASPHASVVDAAEAPAAVPVNHGLSTPVLWMLGALLVVVVALVALMLYVARTRVVPRLSAPEREEALSRLRQWIDPSEVRS